MARKVYKHKKWIQMKNISSGIFGDYHLKFINNKHYGNSCFYV